MTMSFGVPPADPSMVPGVTGSDGTLVIGVPVTGASQPIYVIGDAAAGAGSSSVPYTVNPALVVAASDAPANLRTVADYVCSGTNDHVEIQSALDALIATGGVVWLSMGTFSVGAQLDMGTTGVELRGSGWSTVLQVAAGTGTAEDTVDINASKCGVTNLRITGGSGIGRNGVRVHGSNVYDTYVDNLFIKDVYRTGVGVAATGAYMGRCRVTNVYVENAGNGNTIGKGVGLSSYSEQCFVHNVWATGCTEAGVSIENANDPTGNPRYHTLSNITSWGNNTNGVSLLNADHCTLNGFEVYSNTTNGVQVKESNYSIVANGHTFTNTQDGLEVNDSTSINTVISNVISNANSAHGMNTDGPRTTISNCQFIDNASGDGIFVKANADNVRVIGNVLEGNSRGLRTQAGATNTLVQGNLFTGNGTTLTDNGTTTKIRDNEGYVTEASGTGSVLSAATTDVITHGLDVTPTISDITITWGEQADNDYGRWWVDTIGATTFTVNVSADPGASNADFGWGVTS